MTQNQDKIGPREITVIIVLVSLSHLLWPKNNRLYDSPGNSVWISALLIILTGVAIVFAVMKYTGENGLAGALCQSYGNVLGGIISFLFSLYFMLIVSALLARAEAEMGYFAYTATDKTIMRVVFAMSMMFVACCGMAGVTRTAMFGIIIVACAMALMFVFSMKRMHITRLYPLLGDGALPIGQSAIEMTGCFWSVFAIGSLGRRTGKGTNTRNAAIWGVVISALSLAAVFFVMTCSVSSKVFEQAVSPLLYFSSVIRAGKFVNRVDSLFISAWVALTVIAGAFGIQSSAQLMSRVSNTQTTKPFCVGISGLVMVISSQMQYMSSVTELLKLTWLPAMAIILAGMLINHIRSKNEKE